MEGKLLGVLMESGKNIWDERIIEFIFKIFKTSEFLAEVQDKRAFQLFVLEIERAHELLKSRLNDLPMIMNTRTKGQKSSNFGGLECAEFAKAVRAACDKFFNETEEKNEFISNIREKAKEDEKKAWEFERKTREAYLNSGKDDALEIFRNSGHSV